MITFSTAAAVTLLTVALSFATTAIRAAATATRSGRGIRRGTAPVGVIRRRW